MSWITQLFSRRRLYDDLSAEMQEHLNEKIDDLVAGGMSREEATYAARREFGNPTLLEEQGRRVWKWQTVESILFDIKYALRQLRRNPGYTLTVLLTLAFAIGVNTAVFSMVNALLLRPLPYPEPEKIGALALHADGVGRSGKAFAEDDNSHDGETFETVRDRIPTVIAAAYSGTKGVNLQTGNQARYVQEQRVSAKYFDALGLRMIAGRGFTGEEDRPQGEKVVVLSYEVCQSIFPSCSHAVGEAIRLKGEPHTVVGVLPAGTQSAFRADLWTPLRPSRTGEGGGNNYGVILRLRDGSTWPQVNSQMSTVVLNSYLEFSKNQPTGHIRLFAMPFQADLAGGQRGPVLVLMCAVGFILLIACANLAGLALVRTGRRTQEIATRLALGASRKMILRQLMTEPVLLAFAGGAIGVLLASLTLDSAARLLPKYMLPVGGLAIDGRVLGFAIAASFCTSLLIGILPALEVRRVDIRRSMATRSGESSSGRLSRRFLIAGEVTLTVVLLAGAGLLIRTLVYLQTLPPGFDATNVMTAKVSLDDARYHEQATFQNLLEQSVAAMERIPGVESAAVGLSLPYERGLNTGVKIADGAQKGQQYGSSSIYVTPRYFECLRIPILAGRSFTASDTTLSEPVAIVNVSFAKRYLGSLDVIGRHLGRRDKAYKIIGLVSDVVKRPGLQQSVPLGSEPTFYLPAAQTSEDTVNIAHVWFQPSWLVRTKGPVAGLPQAMQQALAEVDPTLPFAGFHSMSDLQAEALTQQRVEVVLLGVLAGLALLLAMIGVYGLVANLVVQRTREIGIRMALGSTTGEAMMEIGKSGVIAVAYGLVAGLALSALAVGVIKSQLYGVQPFDPLTFIAILALLGFAAIAASLLPTLRISRIDPALTLRAE